MKNVALFIALVFAAAVAYGQNNYRLDGPKGQALSKPPYVLVDTFEVEMHSLIVDKNHIDSINVIRPENAIAAYGEKAKSGAILITPKPQIKLLRLPRILEDYHIAPADRNLRVCINKTLIERPNLILVEAGEIVRVEITTGRNWINPEDANSDERFINIVTVPHSKGGY